MSDLSTPTPDLGGPDLTSSKSLDIPSGKPSWIGSGAGHSRTAPRTSSPIATRMFVVGIIFIVLGAIWWLAGNYADDPAVGLDRMVTGFHLESFGTITALLGLTALAIRER